MRKVLVLWVLLAVAIGVTAAVLPGLDIDGGFVTLLFIALVYSFVNVLIGTVVRVLTLPLTLATLGVFGLVVNAAMLALTAWVVERLSVDNFFTAVVATVLITVCSTILQFLFLRRSSPEFA